MTRLPSCGSTTTSTFPVVLAFRADGTTGDLGSTWQTSPTNPTRPLIGQIDFATGVFDAKPWATVNRSAIGLTGTFTRDGTFTGQARDPAPGFESVFTFGVCDYSVTGEKQ